jgi:N-acyl homoserine lactone hydrolase
MTSSNLRLYVLDTGLIECADYALFSPSAGAAEHYDMPVRSYVVVHPRGTLVWDTGIEDVIHDEPGGRLIMEPIRFKVPRTLRGQLAEIDVEPAAVTFLALSHLHIDHVGNLDLFPDATVLLQAAELEAAFGPDAEALTYIPETYAALHEDKVLALDGEHDVFGDGSVMLVPLPGHTPGHQGLLVRLDETGPVLIAGDVSYSAKDYAAGAVRSGNVDLDASARSIDAVKHLERELGAAVWLHHDADGQRSIRLAPELYS